MNAIRKLVGRLIYRKHKDKFDKYLRFCELHAEPGNLEIYARHPMMPGLAEALIDFFDDANGVNYVAFSVAHPRRGRFTVTVVPENGKSQHEIIEELKNRVLQLEAIAQAVQARTNSSGQCPLCHSEIDPFDGVFSHYDDCPMTGLTWTKIPTPTPPHSQTPPSSS